MTCLGKRAGLLLALLAYVVSAGGHVALTQAVAWTTMIWSEHQDGLTWREAVLVTLEGRRPCCLCRGLAAAETSQPMDAVYSSESREKMKSPPLRWSPLLLTPPAREPVALARDSAPFATRTERPPVPPPRVG